MTESSCPECLEAERLDHQRMRRRLREKVRLSSSTRTSTVPRSSIGRQSVAAISSLSISYKQVGGMVLASADGWERWGTDRDTATRNLERAMAAAS